MIEKITKITNEIEDKIINYRRDFHHYAEKGWTEFRTASLIARRLTELGYDVKAGKEVISEFDRMGVPEDEELLKQWNRAAEQGGDKEFLDKMKGGFTGVVGIISNGHGPITALRFDIDALEIDESKERDHRPFKEGFASVNDGVMHACGHDSHAATGLGVAEILIRLKTYLKGTVKLIFQPAEEGVRGAKSMVKAGVLDDVQYIIGHHVSNGWKVGEIASGMGGYIATKKFDVVIKGKPAHAGGSPQEGNNALMAAATAIMNLYAIPRHGEGATRINVGKVTAGTGRNVICDEVKMVIETRGENKEISQYMYDKAVKVLEKSAEMYDCKIHIKKMGEAQSGESDKELSEIVEYTAEQIGGYTIIPQNNAKGSEDFTYMMEKVQKNRGKAVNIGVGADFHDISYFDKKNRDKVLLAHSHDFDISEKVFKKIIILLSTLVFNIK